MLLSLNAPNLIKNIYIIQQVALKTFKNERITQTRIKCKKKGKSYVCTLN